MSNTFTSWGGLSATAEKTLRPGAAAEAIIGSEHYLPCGAGRSYGDTCLPAGPVAIDARGMNAILAFDPQTGILRAEAGISLAAILDRIIPHGWFLPVTPGTRHVTLGGALANDVHGKNHHRAGTFGNHVRAFELVRSDGTRRICTPEENPGFFAATVGGMGLTGLITWVEIALMRASSPNVLQTTVRFRNLAEYFAEHADADAAVEYGVAWIDSLATGTHLGRGALLLGEHAPTPGKIASATQPARISVPFTPPFALIRPSSLRLFNALYYRAARPATDRLVDYRSFFYPLDAIGAWNRLYGPRGLRQFQCVVPESGAETTVRAMLIAAQQASHGSFLTVLKKFGAAPSPGLLSFPRPGYTLTLDFPYRGGTTDDLLSELDAMALDVRGAVNPYKDARMSREAFERSFPRWREIARFVDPLVQSAFTRRIGLMERLCEINDHAA